MANRSGDTIANAYVQIVPTTDGVTSSLTKSLTGSMDTAGTKAGSAFGSKFSGISTKALASIGGAFAAIFAVGAVADAFQNVEAGFNKVILATGATGEAAAALQETYLNVSKNVVGSFEDIGSAVGELNTRLGLTGEDLELAAEAMMKYARVTGQDATKATQDVASMMRNVGIPTTELTSTLDKLTVAGQAAGIDVSNLANNITKYNAVMKQMGLTTDEQIALMAQFELSGADTATILNAMKKGVAQWSKEGKDAKEEFAKFVKGVQDGTVTAGDAVELFGSKGGLSMYEAAQKGQLSFDKMYQTIVNDSDGALDTVYESTLTAKEKFDLLGQKLSVGFYQVLEPLVEAVGPYLDDIIDIVGSAIDTVVKVFKALEPLLTPIIDGVISAIKGIITVINSVIGALSNMIEGMSTTWQYVADIWYGIRDTISNAIQGAINFISSAVGIILDIFNFEWSLPGLKLPHIIIGGWLDVPVLGTIPDPFKLSVEWYGSGGYVDTPTLFGAGEKGGELVWPSYEPYLSQYAEALAGAMGGAGVDIHDCTFNVRNDDDVRRIGREINAVISREIQGGYA